MKGVVPPQHLALYAKIWLFVTTLLFKTIKKNFSVKSEMLRRGQPPSYTEQFLFVLMSLRSYRLKKNVSLIFELFWINESFDFGSSHMNN